MKKRINVKYVDFSNDFSKENNDFNNILHKHFLIDEMENNDYVFYSSFGYQHTKYNGIKIFYTGERMTPNFNLCDYAIGFDYLEYGDRYLRYPLYKLFQYRTDLIRALDINNENKKVKKESFCAFVVSNDTGMKERKEFFDKLNQYKKISSGGRYLNNVGGPVKDKIEFQSKHKFVIAFENSSYPGYTTEKIVQAFASGSIPIYYGNPEIGKEFNEKAFINCHKYKNFDEVIEVVKKIDNDDDLYNEMLNEPASYYDLLDESELEKFLTNIFSQDPIKAKRRIENAQSKEEEKKEKSFAKKYKFIMFKKRIKNVFRHLKRKLDK